MSAPVYVAPQCPGCDGAGCANCGWSGAAPPLEGVDRCRDCALPWARCACCDLTPPHPLDVAARVVAVGESVAASRVRR